MKPRRPTPAEIEQDIRDHIEMDVQENIGRGMSPEEARFAAMRKFGNVSLVREETLAVWGWTRFEQFVQDVRHGLRTLRRNPGFAAVAVLTLALGIGMNTAVFSVVNAVLLRPLRYPDPERLVWLANYNERFKMEAVAGPDFLDWRNQAQSFERIAGYGYQDSTISAGSGSGKSRVAYVTPDFWAMSGVQPALGRLFQTGEQNVIVLTHPLFARQFGGDPRIVGRQVLLDGRTVTVAGVLPAQFRFLFPSDGMAGIQSKEPEAYSPSPIFWQPQMRGRQMAIMLAVAKLKPGVPLERARAEMQAIQARIARDNPHGFYDLVQLRVLPLREKLTAGARPALLVVLGAVGFVLLIVCANLGNLLLARATSRRRETAIRAALGAGRTRLIRQFLAEGIVLALIGSAAGLLLARTAVDMILRLGPRAMPRLGETTIDASVLAYTLAISIATALVFGLAPALSLPDAALHDSLKDGGRTSSAGLGRMRVRGLLVAAEIGLALVLLTGAGLLAKSYWLMSARPPGFEPDRIVVMKVSLSGPGYRQMPPQLAYARKLLDTLAVAPGVQAAGITNSPNRGLVSVEGASPLPPGVAPQAVFITVSSGYCRAMGMRLVKGRWLTDDEPEPVALVNEAFVRAVFGRGEPLGRRVRIPRPQAPMAAIAGVVADLKASKLDADPEPEIYLPYRQSPFLRSLDVVAKVAADAPAAAPALRKLVAALDPTQPVYDVGTVEQALAASVAPRRFNMMLLGVFAAVALTLALIGVYGLVAYAVTQRRQEIGVRIALGARRRDVVGMIVRQAMALAFIGVAAGIAAALALTRLMTGLLYHVHPADAPTFCAVALALLGAALFASWRPAVKAAAVDPLVALRHE
jgi:putative ABC transport system permease protein